MDIQNGKFYDAKKMREFCDGWKDLVNNYIEKKSLSDGEFSTFQDTESFRGMTADASKFFVKKGMGRMLSEVAKTQRKMRKAQTEVMELFENMVDPSQNARIEYDTLETINNDFKNLYYIYKDRADNVRKIVDCLNDEFGNYAYFEQPDSQTGLDAFYDFCGGDSDTAGYLRKCQDKLAAFDMQAKALLSGKDTMTKTENLNTHIVNTKIALAPAPTSGVTSCKVTLNPVDNSKATANAKKNTKDDMYKYLQSYYGFTDDEMTYLKENYPGLLSSLYGTTKYSSNDADKVYKNIRGILDLAGFEYLNAANKLIDKYNLTDDQYMYVKNVSSLIGYKYTYKDTKGNNQVVELSAEKVAGMQVVAAALYDYGKKPEFVACVLGNIAFEGGPGHIEDSNYPGKEPAYLKSLEHYFEYKTIVDAGETEMIIGGRFDKEYADERIYSIDNPDSFLDELELYRAETKSDNICGIGMCQWTTRSRLQDLLSLYNRGDYSYSDIVEAEATMIVKELSGEYDNDVDGVDDYCENKYASLPNKEQVRESAKYFYAKYERGATSTSENRADVAFDIYQAMQ